MTAKDIALSELHTLKEIIKDVKDIELRNTKGMRERRVLAVRKERNRAVRICLKGS